MDDDIEILDIFDISEDNLYYYKDTISQKNNFILYAL